MRLLLLHNPAAGGDEPPATALVTTLEDGGHTVLTRDPGSDDWLAELGPDLDAVVAAGGDGTVRRAALVLARARSDVPLAMLPQGTANNIARSVGATGTATDLAAALGSAVRSRLAIGVAEGRWGRREFVESAGVGFFTTLLGSRPPEEDRGPREARLAAAQARLRRHLEEAPPLHLTLQADGVNLTGRYLLAEALNIPAVGPGAPLAPDADYAEAALRLVLVGASERSVVADSLDRLARGETLVTRLPSRPVTELVLDWPDGRGHVDDEVWPVAGTGASTPAHAPPGRVTLRIMTTIPILVPGRRP
ncbi:MAG: NAD(+)/NADH kinase [Gemmatimonadetes bacterium]|nr:NAD(+)/NADH kinase [Gemmatimonadota bacterium]